MAIHYLEQAALTDLQPSTKLVLMCMADSANKDDRVGHPGLDAVRQWSGLGKSRALEVIAELITKGYLVRQAYGQKGRRAEYVVFPHGCCAEHAPLRGYEARPAADADDGSAVPDPSDSVENGSGVPDPMNSQGPGQGPGEGPAITGPLPTSVTPPTTAEGASHPSSGEREQPPSIPSTPDGVHRTCGEHRDRPALGPCPPCGDWRRAVDAAQAQLATELAERAAAERRASRQAADLAAAERTGCGLCDVEGTALVRLYAGVEDQAETVTTKCLHDAGRNQRSVEIRRAAKASLAARSRQVG